MKWQKNVLKKARNLGEEYMRNNKTLKSARKMREPCHETCLLKCTTKITEEERAKVFSEYWKLGNLEKQRQFIRNCMEEINPQYRYVRQSGSRAPRKKNLAFYFHINADKKIRVCNMFFENTLDINSRVIKTTREKTKTANLLDTDNRGKHGNHFTVDPAIREDIQNFIKKIPRIETFYFGARSSKEYIEGSKSISELHTDYVEECKQKNFQDDKIGIYTMFYRIFTTEFNISFFKPKKDQCYLCISYENRKRGG